MLLQVGLGGLCVYLGLAFIRSERGDLGKVSAALAAADLAWVVGGGALVLGFVGVQGWMYRISFRAVGKDVRLSTCILLFLKRNLISVFLPAGTLTNLAFFNQDVKRRDGVDREYVYFAGTIFSFCSILTGVLVGIPAGAWLFFREGFSATYVLGIVVTSLLLAGIGWAIVNLLRRGVLYHWLDRRHPSATAFLASLEQEHIATRYLWQVTGLSLLVEGIGVAHLYIATAALGGSPTLELAVVGYGIVLLLLMSSPFLRGIGAIEAALTYALTQFGYPAVTALGIAFLFRFFEFWSVLLLGVVALVARRDLLLWRVWPTVLLLLLGAVSIWSALTPGLPGRLRQLRELIPGVAIATSTWVVLVAGVAMLLLSYYLLRGYRRAWWAAAAVSGLTLIGHLTKGIDWEESSLAALTLLSLLLTRQDYFLRSLAPAAPPPVPSAALTEARELITELGDSSLDYFKTYADKLLWLAPDRRGVVAYRVALGYAVALEGPVCRQEDRPTLIRAFDTFARQQNLRTGYYRLPASQYGMYEAAGKTLFPIGEEATVDLTKWSLQGAARKELRNSTNKLTKQGYVLRVNAPPQRPGFLQQLRVVSEEWLDDIGGGRELTFSQGVFDEAELAEQPILSVESADGRVVAFLNIIPSGKTGEGTFDLMRKLHDAPNGTMDFLFCQVFDYFKRAGLARCNLGMVPLSGIEQPKSAQERAVKLAYEDIRGFAHYRSLRHFKEKFDPAWEMMYLAYTTPLDLLELPLALERVVKT